MATTEGVVPRGAASPGHKGPPPLKPSDPSLRSTHPQQEHGATPLGHRAGGGSALFGRIVPPQPQEAGREVPCFPQSCLRNRHHTLAHSYSQAAGPAGGAEEALQENLPGNGRMQRQRVCDSLPPAPRPPAWQELPLGHQPGGGISGCRETAQERRSLRNKGRWGSGRGTGGPRKKASDLASKGRRSRCLRNTKQTRRAAEEGDKRTDARRSRASHATTGATVQLLAALRKQEQLN